MPLGALAGYTRRPVLSVNAAQSPGKAFVTNTITALKILTGANCSGNMSGSSICSFIKTEIADKVPVPVK